MTVGPQRRGPGLIGTAARTAVIAGTATAVSKGVSGAMDSGAQQRAVQEQQRAAQEQQRVEATVQQALAEQQAQQAVPVQPPPPPAPEPAAPALGGAERIALLQQLAELKSQGILTDAEFEAEKARILAS